jgi:hypothetical protein
MPNTVKYLGSFAAAIRGDNAALSAALPTTLYGASLKNRLYVGAYNVDVGTGVTPVTGDVYLKRLSA